MNDEALENDITNPVKNGKMTAKEFWVRLVIWVIFAAVIPVAYIAAKYKIFTAKDESYKLTGWGIIAIIIVAVFLISLIKEVLAGLPKGSMIRQCITGAMKLIPFFLLLLVVHAIKNSIEAFEGFLVVLIVSEAVATPINPLPKWAAQNNVEIGENAIFKAISRAAKGYIGKKDKE